MMHEIVICSGNGAGSTGLGMSKIDHRKSHCLWFGEESCVCTKSGASRVVGSRKGGTCTSSWRWRLHVQSVFPLEWY